MGLLKQIMLTIEPQNVNYILSTQSNRFWRHDIYILISSLSHTKPHNTQNTGGLIRKGTDAVLFTL